MTGDPLRKWSDASVYATVGLVIAAALCEALGLHAASLAFGGVALVVVLRASAG